MVPGCFSALWSWCLGRRSQGLSKDSAVPQAVAPAGATQTSHRDAPAISLTHPYSVPSSGNAVDAPDLAPSQGSVPSIASPQVVPTDAQVTMPYGSTTADIAGTSALGDSGSNPGQAQPGLFPGPQDNHVAEPVDMTSPPSSSPNGSLQHHPFNPTQSWSQGLLNGSNSQGNTTPSTPGPTNSTIFVSSPLGVNGIPTLNPAVQPTSSAVELPPSPPSTDFMQSVMTSLDDVNPQALVGSGELGIDFEQFREWFDLPPEEPNGMSHG
ncbi:hypothetical protein EDD15DRAFT_2255367 [Pisolithus albus]|nr:hypothetical protein EDD15DRAFT_2255367 [Pisolithus albus]